MPDRPSPDDGVDDGDGPDYHWLYGAAGDPDRSVPATRPVRRQPDPRRDDPRDGRRDDRRDPRRGDGRAHGPGDGQGPDRTQVMRTQPRPTGPTGSGRATQVRPTPRPVAPGPAPAPAGRGPRDRRPRRWRPRFRFRYVPLVLLAWVIFVVATPISAFRGADEVAFEPSGDRPASQPGTTYLLVGSDSRAGLSKAQRKEFHTGGDVGQRTDTIQLLHTGSGPNLLMSIPRDSQVAIPGHGTTKINAAYAYGGAKLLTQTIEQDTGIRIDQFVEIGMAGLVGVVDSVGGVDVCPRMNMNDKLAGLKIKKGCQQVDGQTALAYARSRHVSNLGDIDRVRRQREVVAAVGKAVLSPWTAINPVRWWRINHAVPDFFRFGDGMGPTRIALWATAMTRVSGDKGLTCGVPIANLNVDWDPDRSQRMFDLIKTDQTDKIGKSLCSATGIQQP